MIPEVPSAIASAFAALKESNASRLAALEGEINAHFAPPPPWAPVLTLTAVPSQETGAPTDLIADPTGTPAHPDGDMVCAMRLYNRGNFYGGGSPLSPYRINGAAQADMTPGTYTVELEVTVNGIAVTPIATATYTVTQGEESLVVSVP